MHTNYIVRTRSKLNGAQPNNSLNRSFNSTAKFPLANRINDWIGHRADVVNTSSGLRNFGWKFYLKEIMKNEIGPLRKIADHKRRHYDADIDSCLTIFDSSILMSSVLAWTIVRACSSAFQKYDWLIVRLDGVNCF